MHHLWLLYILSNFANVFFSKLEFSNFLFNSPIQKCCFSHLTIIQCTSIKSVPYIIKNTQSINISNMATLLYLLHIAWLDLVNNIMQCVAMIPIATMRAGPNYSNNCNEIWIINNYIINL